MKVLVCLRCKIALITKSAVQMKEEVDGGGGDDSSGLEGCSSRSVSP